MRKTLAKLMIAILFIVPLGACFMDQKSPTAPTTSFVTQNADSTASTQKPGATPAYATLPQCYMWRFPFCGSWGITCKYGCNRHTGLDYYAIDWSLPGEQDFNQPVLAPASGWVVWSGYKGDYGNQVIVDTGNGIFYRVAHLNWLRFSNARQYVYQGQTLGGAGHTGAAEGTHIHFVVYSGSYLGSGSMSGVSIQQEGINGQWTLNVGSSYPSGQTCSSW